MQTGIDILMKMVGLHAIRKKKGYSQLKVAMDLSISREAISYYENGLRCPNLEMLVKLSDYFNVSIDYLITGKNFGEQSNKLFCRINHRSAQNVKFHKNVLTNRLNGDIIYLALKFISKFAEPTFIISSVEINIGVQLSWQSSGLQNRVPRVQVLLPLPNKNANFDTKLAFFLFARKALFYGLLQPFYNFKQSFQFLSRHESVSWRLFCAFQREMG